MAKNEKNTPGATLVPSDALDGFFGFLIRKKSPSPALNDPHQRRGPFENLESRAKSTSNHKCEDIPAFPRKDILWLIYCSGEIDWEKLPGKLSGKVPYFGRRKKGGAKKKVSRATAA